MDCRRHWRSPEQVLAVLPNILMDGPDFDGVSEAILAQAILAQGNPIKTRHGPCCFSPSHQVHSQLWNRCTKLGRSQPRAGLVGRLSRARWEKEVQQSKCSLAMSRRSMWVSWGDSSREQAVPSAEDAVMEDCTESHQSEIKKKIKANDKQRNILTPMPLRRQLPVEHAIHGRREGSSTGRQKAIPTLAKLERKSHLERISKDIEKKQQPRLEILQKWIEADQELELADSTHVQAKREMVILVAEQTAENAEAVNQGVPVVQTQTTGTLPDKAAQQTIFSVFKSVLSMQSMGRHSASEQLMAAGATEEDVKKVSQIMAHTVRQLEAGTARPEPGPEAHRLPCEDVVTEHEFSAGKK